MKKIAFLFPGQGSQYLNMAKDLAINFPPGMEASELMDALFQEEGQAPLSSAQPKHRFAVIPLVRQFRLICRQIGHA